MLKQFNSNTIVRSNNNGVEEGTITGRNHTVAGPTRPEISLPSNRHASLNRFNSMLDEWLQTKPNKYVAMKDGQEIGFYDSEDEALKAAYTEFGYVPFFVRRIESNSSLKYTG